MSIDERYFYGAHGIDIEKAKQAPNTGYWKPAIVRGIESFICSECSAECCYVTTNYCPSCGAGMLEREVEK